MNDRSFTLTRTIDAPRDDVWASWTDPAELRWFFSGMEGSGEQIDVDLRVGGAWRLLMVVSPTDQYVTGGVYRELVPTEKLVFSWGAAGGWPAIGDDLDAVPQTTIELRDIHSATELSLTAWFADELSDEKVTEWLECGMREGWGMTIDRLVEKFARP